MSRELLLQHLNQNHPAASLDRVVLLSGGLDSYVTLIEALEDGPGTRVFPIGFDYGQKSVKELSYAKRQIVSLRSRYHPHTWIAGLHTVTIRGMGGSSLLGEESTDEAEVLDEPTHSFVPMRNATFLSIAYGYAESLGAGQVWCGLTDTGADGGSTPDARIEFLQALELTMRLGAVRTLDRESPSLHAPLLRKPTKVAALVRARELGADLSLVWTCFAGGARPCERCRACRVLAQAKELLASADETDG